MTILWKNLHLIWDCGVTDLVYSGLWEYIKGRVLGVQRVKRRLDNYLALLPDIPCTPNKDNSITGTVVEDQSWCLQRDGLAD